MLNLLDLSDRTILVTGASSGIGRATSVLLSQLGARIVLVGRRVEQLEHTASLMESDRHLVRPCDLSKSEEIPAWLKQLSRETGPLHGLVHSAGVQVIKPVRFLNQDTFDELMLINLTVAMQLAKGFRQKDVCTKPSSVVFLSSVMGIVGQPGLSAYAASKAGLIGLAKSLALELAPEGIRVNCVAPGQVRTEMAERMEQTLGPDQVAKIESMHPLGLGEPRDVACSIAFLLADTAKWMTGSTLVVDGGYTAH